MPHDKNGQVVKAGDYVKVDCLVESVAPADEYCNLTLKTAEPMYPTESPVTIVLNAKQVELQVLPPQSVIEALELAIAVSGERLLPFFRYGHLPVALQDVSLQFARLALWIVTFLATSPERTVALRKLLEAKDCAVRTAL